MLSTKDKKTDCSRRNQAWVTSNKGSFVAELCCAIFSSLLRLLENAARQRASGWCALEIWTNCSQQVALLTLTMQLAFKFYLVLPRSSINAQLFLSRYCKYSLVKMISNWVRSNIAILFQENFTLILWNDTSMLDIVCQIRFPETLFLF